MEIFPCEHTLTLVQKEGIKIAEKSIAKCNDCDLSSNLWLCLTCGNLSCGRKETGGNQGFKG
jgi:ubiquitin carboxyl-terminal hydrolase 5/13